MPRRSRFTMPALLRTLARAAHKARKALAEAGATCGVVQLWPRARVFQRKERRREDTSIESCSESTSDEDSSPASAVLAIVRLGIDHVGAAGSWTVGLAATRIACRSIST